VGGFDIGCHDIIAFLMTNSISTTSWAHEKYSWHSYNASWQPMSKPTTWQINFILCQVVMTSIGLCQEIITKTS